MRGGSQYLNWQINMEYNDAVKKLNELIEKIKIAEEQENIHENSDNIIEEKQDIDYMEQYLNPPKEIEEEEHTPEELKEEFDKTVESAIKNLEDKKSKLQQDIEDRLNDMDDTQDMYLVSELQTKITTIDHQINGIKEISDNENKREEELLEQKKREQERLEEQKKMGVIKQEFIQEELDKLESRKQELEQKNDSQTLGNQYTEEYLQGETKTELDSINSQIAILKMGKFTKNQINRAMQEIDKLNEEKHQLKANMPSLNAQDYNELYLLGEQQQIINRMEERINEINERLYRLSVFNPDINKLREEQENKMWEQYRTNEEEEKNRQIDEAFKEKEEAEKDSERKILQATRKEIIYDELDLKAKESQKSSKQSTQPQTPTPTQRPATQPNPQTRPQGQVAQYHHVTQKSIVNPNLPGLKIVYDRANNTYVMTDESRAYNATYYFQSTYLKNKSKERVLEDIGRIRGKEVMPYVLGEIDCNLYYCLSRFDRETGSHKAEEYIESLETGKQINDLDVTYDLRGNRRLSLINDFRQRRIANKSETAIGAKVEKGENKIIKAIKDLFKKVKTTSLPYPDMHLEDGKDINGQEIPSKDIDEKEDFSERIKVHQYSKPEIASYVNAFLTRNEQTEKRDITAASKAEYIQQLRAEGLSEDMITEISEKIEMQEIKNNQTQGLNR